ncbi:ABC transporter substrate-binding protein [Erwinia pyrifoliae]|uniref:ABC transporter substrate-binding protein n=1 Tax=Erwinia pyrifoliae TaxID=79967 RepID=UPI00223BA592|nr:ABC transporter substrate-binding protein [Erwinia pyrifoliae]MCT2386859.1 ABC transporter substrate-binding protein [Erwinia pyrifoliae]MCU8587542.1 ABC transporter substrate-binding protein [Erwinia pyrifoliae]
MLKFALSPLLAMLLAVVNAPVNAAPERVAALVAPFEIKGSDPTLSGDIFLKMSIVETLVNADSHGQPLPGLASSWSVTENGLVWRFTLRSGVKFHDGSTLTAQNVVNALNVARSKPGLLDKAPIADIRAEEQQVLIALTQPFTPLLSMLAENRAQILAAASYNDAHKVVQVIGTGPYRLTSLQPPQKLTVARFHDYWGAAPSIEQASYMAVGRAETRALLAESGNADLVLNLDPASRSRLNKNAKVQLLSMAIPRSVLLKVNVGHPLLADVRARQALSMALDRDGIARAILRYPAAADQLFPPSVAQWHNASLAPMSHNLPQARALLAELGWKPGAEGTLQRNGQLFSLTLTTYPDRPELPLIAAAIQQQLRDIGVQVAINTTNSGEIAAMHHDGTLELALVARNFALTPEPLGTLLQDYAPRGGDWGAMNWSNATFDQTLARLETGSNAADSQQQRELLTRILQSELPTIPVVWYQQSAAVSPRLSGAVLDPFERSFGLEKMRWAE